MRNETMEVVIIMSRTLKLKKILNYILQSIYSVFLILLFIYIIIFNAGEDWTLQCTLFKVMKNVKQMLKTSLQIKS